MGLQQFAARLSGRIPESSEGIEVHLITELRWNKLSHWFLRTLLESFVIQSVNSVEFSSNKIMFF